MQPGIPGSPPPASAFPSSGQLGPQAGVQAKQTWKVGEQDERQLLSCLRAPHLWRVTLHGENILFRVSWGTSANITVSSLHSSSQRSYGIGI